MTQDFVTQVIYNGVMLVLLLSLPSVGLGLLVGFIISLFQAVTQIQEQTLTFVPKMVTVMMVIAFTSPWMASLMVDFMTTLWANIPNMVR
ncbi:MAG: flagellar biosynthesis protein FliQ [Candidatus Saganbacteria bacterium]|nr:flagellar biosynthesis protein FliQ [Candidatus Saganbacteria bacterium]